MIMRIGVICFNYCFEQVMLDQQDCRFVVIYFIIFIHKMTIRYKANISQQITKLDNLHPNHYQSCHYKQPSTPEFVNGPTPNFNNAAILRQTSLNFSSNIVGLKEHNIKALDDKINSIMKKHTKNGQHVGQYDFRNLLEPNNFQKNTSIHNNIKQQSRSSNNSRNEYLRSYQENTRDFNDHKKQRKEECRRLRERSMIIFDETNNKNSQIQSLNPQGKHNRQNKYNSQIEKLNERIKKAEQKKKQLNIQFSPFSKKRLSDYKSKKNSINEELIQKNTRSKNRQSFLDSNTKQSVCIDPKGFIKRNTISPSQLSNYTVAKTSAFVLQEQNLSQTQPVKGLSRYENSITKEIVQALIKQIQLDEELRNLKIWFTFNNEKDKWDHLKQLIKNNNLNIPLDNLKTIFESGIEEHNPFFRWDGVTFQEGVEKMLTAYKQSQYHWENTIAKHWSSKQLNSPQLRRTILYDQRTRTITIEDLVRFINMQKDTFYRNRDLYLIYRRLSSKSTNNLQYSSFVDALSEDGA